MNKMKEEKMGKARIGVFSVGYDKYWSQFPGLLDELLKRKPSLFVRFLWRKWRSSVSGWLILPLSLTKR